MSLVIRYFEGPQIVRSHVSSSMTKTELLASEGFCRGGQSGHWNQTWRSRTQELLEASLVIKPACRIHPWRHYTHSLADTPASRQGAWFFVIHTADEEADLLAEARKRGRKIAEDRWHEKAAMLQQGLDAGCSPSWLRAIWNKGKIIPHCDPTEWRRDIQGRTMQFIYWGTKSQYGWEVDHIKPISRRGSLKLPNLQPLHWRTNLEKAHTHPWTPDPST